ncbi:MAG: LysR family transcriptional regulator [Proteobacteria bacterium]|nr:LysR family transcriptional regulator [Pseudomonadota bacterium]
MSLEEIATFVEAVDQGSLAGAARILGVPKSTVSRRVTRLEEALGQELVLRHSRLFQITEAGDALYHQSVGAVRDLRSAEQFVRDGATAIRGQLRISLPHDMAVSPPFVHIFAEFRRAYPEVELTLDISDRMVDLVGEGFDFAFRAHSQQLDDSSVLKVRRLHTVPIGLFASSAYLDARGRPEVPSDLSGHCCVSMKVSPGLDVWPLLRGAETVAVEIQPTIRASSMAFMPMAVLEDVGIAVMPLPMLSDHVASGRVERVLPEWSLPSAALSLLWPASRLPSPRRRAFLDFAVSRVKSLEWKTHLGGSGPLSLS